MEPVRAVTDTLEKLSSATNRNELFKILTRCSCYETDSSFSALYLKKKGKLLLECLSHNFDIPVELNNKTGLVDFIFDCKDFLVFHGSKSSFLTPFFLLPAIKSATAFPLCEKGDILGVLILNSERENFYGRKKLNYLESITRISVSSLSRILSASS
jgi:hypothetical protein